MLAVFVAFSIYMQKHDRISNGQRKQIIDAVRRLYFENFSRAPESASKILKDMQSEIHISEIIDVVASSCEVSKPNSLVNYQDAIKIVKSRIVICEDIGCLVFKDDRYMLITCEGTFNTKSKTKLKDKLFENGRKMVSFLVLK
jgi:hypothetical protein